MPPNPQAKLLLDQGLAAFRAGQPQRALERFSRALESDPNSVELANRIGGVLMSVGALPQAHRVLSMATERFVNDPGTFSNLGTVAINLGRADEAMHAWRRALEIDPHFTSAQFNLANLLKSTRKPDEAEQMLHALLAHESTHVDAWFALGHIRRDLGDCTVAVACFERVLALKPQHQPAQSALLYTLLFDDRFSWQEVVARHIDWGNRFGATPALEHSNARAADRRLRLGYLSPFFLNHVNAELIAPILAEHDRSQFEIFAYCNSEPSRSDERRLRPLVDHWHACDKLSDDLLFARIRTDAIDILIDLTSHMDGARLQMLARKPAPIQINYLAYPATSGLRSIDYRVTCPQLDPVGTEDPREPEKLIRLPDTYWCYPTTHDIAVGPPPSETNGCVTFGCLNAFVKVREACVALWGKILDRVPNSRLVLLVRGGEGASSIRKRLATLLIDPARVTLVDYVNREKHLERFNQIDVCLDSFPYGGHVTTHDAMWMGVPVVTMADDTPISRAGACILSHVDLSNLVARSNAEYVNIATRLAADIERRRELRLTLRDRMRVSRLVDAKRFTRVLETGYRAAWRRWCNELPPANIDVD